MAKNFASTVLKKKLYRPSKANRIPMRKGTIPTTPKPIDPINNQGADTIHKTAGTSPSKKSLESSKSMAKTTISKVPTFSKPNEDMETRLTGKSIPYKTLQSLIRPFSKSFQPSWSMGKTTISNAPMLSTITSKAPMLSKLKEDLESLKESKINQIQGIAPDHKLQRFNGARFHSKQSEGIRSSAMKPIEKRGKFKRDKQSLRVSLIKSNYIQNLKRAVVEDVKASPQADPSNGQKARGGCGSRRIRRRNYAKMLLQKAILKEQQKKKKSVSCMVLEDE